MSADDKRPSWLRPYSLVAGRVSSAPLDLPARMEAVYAALKAAGWRVVVKSIGTDFSGPLGLPVPKDQPIELYLHRAGSYSASDAQGALKGALRAVSLDYSPTGAWLGELAQHVVVPSIEGAKTFGKWGTVALVGGGLIAAVLFLRDLLPRKTLP